MGAIHSLLSDLQRRDAIAVGDHDREVTGARLAGEVHVLAETLADIGLRDGHAVLLRMGSTVDCVVALLATMKCGAIAYVGNPYDPTERVVDTVTRFVPHLLIADTPTALLMQARMGAYGAEIIPLGLDGLRAVRFAANAAPLTERLGSARNAGLAIFSSGTTGDPKAILHSIDSVFANAALHAEAIDLGPDDIVGCALPIYFSYGLVANLFASLLTGATVRLHEKSAAIDERWLHERRIGVLALTPFFAQQMKTESPYLRTMTFGGDALTARIGREALERFPHCRLYATYGLTEAGPRVATWRLNETVFDKHDIAPLGTPLRGVEIGLTDAYGNSVEHGELVVKTPTRMLGYFQGIDKGFHMPCWPEGEVHTGDVYERRDGELFFVGRMKEIIVQSGEKIYPLAIELVIQSIEGVIDVRVDAVPDPRKGQIARALIHADPSVTPKVVRRALLQRFSAASLPEQMEFVESIPRSHTGKKLRRREEGATS